MSEDDEDWFEQALSESDGDGPVDAQGESPTNADATDSATDAGPDEDWFEDEGTSESDPAEEDGDSTVEEDDDSLFDEDFASALESTGGPGGDGGEGADGEGFDEEDFESAIPRIDLGIEGLDEMIQGGVPQRHLMVVIGSPGTGKTTFGLQFLHHGLENGENAVFITLEQSRESILDTADERGWAFKQYERDDKLAIVDLDPVEMANSLKNIRAEFPELVREFDADRLVLDSVSLLEMMYDDQAQRRTEVFDFTRSLKNAGVTTMLTSEANEDNPYASRHGIIEYLTDAVFVLQYVRGDTQETRLAVEIQKIRNANHSRQTKPYAITLDGIDVYQQASIF
ncbi:KaiC domain-containing protein [Halorhabdus salina]|uniref:KaiC domain-containing protein n=1 Tax=Halorhabdus salina TaxID=2750670 RepID=UPI0015EF4CB4|nr:KaiC domain-containing protein [Halorhabdus salina]